MAGPPLLPTRAGICDAQGYHRSCRALRGWIPAIFAMPLLFAYIVLENLGLYFDAIAPLVLCSFISLTSTQSLGERPRPVEPSRR
jgi:hypothetical protein